MSTAYFSADSLRFLEDLSANNDRDWFKANKARYEASVRQPFLRLLTDLQGPLSAQLPPFVPDPRPVGGSLFRIHRDTRFSNDKRPYKTHAGAAIKHREAADGSPLLYFHLAADGCFFGAGIYHPPAPVLRQLRDFIVDNPRAWAQARDAVLQAGLSFGGDSLTRPPRGFPPDHPLIEDLKRKDFIVSRPVDDTLVCSDRLLPWLVDCAVQAQPLLDYQCAALDLPSD
ncbi:MAG: DUF2461 domain-containing protein [Lysobacterales bacterium]